jgi:NAD(P)-dependent dehydrogenase (short-subunit alcohol dehydrogenase family)
MRDQPATTEPVSSRRFAGRTAVVTGLRLAAEGAAVAVTYRERARDAAAVVAELAALGARAVALPLDVREAAAVAFLASADAAFTTGVTLLVDGGYTLK